MNKLCVALSTALSIATMAALGAQQEPTVTKGTRVTVSGCLEQAAPAKPTGTSGDVDAVAPDTKFVLTTSVTGTPTATTGTTGPISKVMYRLDDGSEPKLSAHEGQKVEITGRIEDEGQAAPSDEEDKPGPQVQAPKLKVESVKMIAWSCAPQ